MIHASSFWVNHFKQNAKVHRVDWKLKPKITPTEKAAIGYSLKAWQLGETSDGNHLKAAAAKYAARIGDKDYVESVDLFIKEEQKHGANLGRYIDAIGEERTKKDWGDTLFRKIRYLNTSMELWTITVIIVESAAQVFYEALRNATDCALLKSICNDILIDEAHHIKYQNERLATIFAEKAIYNKSISVGLYGLLFFGTIHAIWFGHRRALKAGGVTKADFMRMMYFKFLNSMRFLFTRPAEEPVATLRIA